MFLAHSYKSHGWSVAIVTQRRSPGEGPLVSILRTGLITLACSVVSTPVLADSFQPFVRTSIDRDDNLFRRSEGESRGSDDDADTIRTIGGGTRFSIPVSRQLISGVADVASVKFDRNRQLDYTRKDVRGDWHWFVAKHFEGHVGGRYLQELAPFADFDSERRNLRTDKRRYADGSWRFHSSWRWHAGYAKDDYTYDLPSQRANARTEDAVVTGFDYLARSGSTVGLQLRRLDGAYPLRPNFGNTDLFASGYVQDEAKINVLWLATGSTQILFLGGWVERKLKADADRAKSGTNARLIVNWTPAARAGIVVQAWREFSAIDGALIDSALNDGASAQLKWEFSAKIHAIADVMHEKRTFEPFDGVGAPIGLDASSDSSRTRSVALIYKPLRSLTLKARAFQQERTGSIAAGTKSYKANGAALSAILEFH